MSESNSRVVGIVPAMQSRPSYAYYLFIARFQRPYGDPWAGAYRYDFSHRLAFNYRGDH